MSQLQTTGPVLDHLTLLERQVSAVLRALPVKHGKHRVLDRVFPRPLRQRGSRVSVPFAHHGLSIDVGNLVGWHFAMLRDFDPEVAEVLVAAADPSATRSGTEVFWDVGANQGTCSYLVADALPEARVVAIEPQHAMTAVLQSNLGRIAAGRFEVHAVGVGAEHQVLELTVPDGNDGAATLHARERGVRGRVEEVTVVPAEELVGASAFGWPTLVKIDVEGHEADVFESLRPAIEDRRCRAVVFENHAGEDATFASVRSLVEAHGYQVFAITKTPFRTRLRRTTSPVPGVTDYAVLLSPGTATPALARLTR